MKKVLIITYYWPPTGGSGVQRWLKFVKYLPQFGYEPHVYTPENPEMSVFDESLLHDIPKEAVVVKRKIWEPYNIYKWLLGKNKNDKIFLGNVSSDKKEQTGFSFAFRLRGNLLIPDPKLFWIRPSVKFLKSYIRQHQIDCVISSGPPHSMHLIGLQLKKQLGIKWIADFRDPWTNIDFYKDMHLNPISDFLHRYLEKKVVKTADCTLVIGKTMQEEFSTMGAKRTAVITNGFDKEIEHDERITQSDKFILSHIGTFTHNRNHPILWKVLRELIEENENFANSIQLQLIGKTDNSIKENIEKENLSKYYHFINYLPHNEVIVKQNEASVLLLPLNDAPNVKGILTGKFFEYLATGNPILAIAPNDGDLAAIINETKSGYVINFDDETGLKKAILQLFENRNSVKHNFQNSILKYHRKTLTKDLVKLIENIN